MAWLPTINPLNYLAGKIFLMFWLMIATTIITMLLITSQLEPGLQDTPIPAKIIARIEAIEAHVSRSHHQNNDNLERFLTSPRVNHHQRIVFGQPGQPLKTGQPLPKQFKIKHLNRELTRPTTVLEAGHLVYGPFAINHANQTYQLFVASRLPNNPMIRFKYLPHWLHFGIPLAISAVLSFLVALSLVKPINKLCAAHRSLAQGNLDTRSNGVALRKDELGQLGQDFDHMAQQITALLAAQKRLLGDVSHELRSPLARMQVALGLANQPNAKDLPRHLERIELEADRLDDMIGDVLRLSRLESQLQNIEHFELSLKSLLNQLVKDADFEAKSVNKSVSFYCPQEINIKGDLALLASAFENVIRNAVKYSDEDTCVEVSVLASEQQAEIQIRDHGPGVPTSALSQLFQPFYRVSDSRQRTSGGTGLGLAIAQKSILSHGGTIVAHNGIEYDGDKGLMVTIKLPLDGEAL